jgi:hypothetical protein
MMNKWLVLVLCMYPILLSAQTSITGTVMDYENKMLPLEKVTVRNLTSNKATQTKAGGQFTLPASAGDILEFSLVGYHTDTLYLIDMAPKKIFLPRNSTELEEVRIQSAKISPYLDVTNPDAREQHRVMTDAPPTKNNQRAGGLNFNLGYGKYKRDKEKILMLEERDKWQDEIRNNFNEDKIKTLIPLKGQPLKDFMEMYRPTEYLIQTARPFNYDYYIVEAYHTWLRLPPAQRRLPPIPKLDSN